MMKPQTASRVPYFGPEVIFGALVEEGVEFRFVGFIMHYAAELYRSRRGNGPENRRSVPRSHAENLDRLAGALRGLDAGVRVEGDEAIEPFVGQSDALAAANQWFETPHGNVKVTVRDPAGVSPPSGIDAGVTIAIDIPIGALRTYVATGQFARLDEVLEIVELFKSA